MFLGRLCRNSCLLLEVLPQIVGFAFLEQLREPQLFVQMNHVLGFEFIIPAVMELVDSGIGSLYLGIYFVPLDVPRVLVSPHALVDEQLVLGCGVRVLLRILAQVFIFCFK